MMRTRHVRGRSAFSLIELLVVIAIIALLTGVLVPGIKVVTRSAKRLKQSSVFHGYRTGLELFSKDFNDYYPDSEKIDNGLGLINGAQHLAEALMGIDQKGFDPKSKWYAPSHGNDVYASAARGSTAAQVAASENRRREVYVEQKDDGCYALEDIYGVGSIGSVYSPLGFGSPRAPVLTDIFKRKRIELTTAPPGVTTIRVKVGTPVLYFKADTTTRFMDPRSVYDYEDNQAIIELGTVLDPTVKHRYDQSESETVNGTPMDGDDFFYHKITNPDVDAFEKPYNPRTYILMSAGPDGVFGTKDDVTNFE